MARRRLTPSQPGYLGPNAMTGLETKSALSDPVLPADSSTLVTDGPPARPYPTPTRPTPPIAAVSGQSAEAAALREITAGIDTARATGRMVVDVPLGEVSQGYLARDRVALNNEEIAALKASIRAHGQRTPAEITPLHGIGRDESDGAPAQPWGLISGWRRLRALSDLYDETGDIRFSTLRALVRPPEEAAQSYIAMVEENEVRAGLSYYERARVVAEATARGVFPDQSAALRSMFATASRAKRSKIGSFIDLHEALGDLLHFPADIPERLGLALVSRLRLGCESRIRTALRTARPTSATVELALLENLSQPPRAGVEAGQYVNVSRAKHRICETLAPGVELRLRKTGGRIEVILTGPGVDASLLTRLRDTLTRA